MAENRMKDRIVEELKKAKEAGQILILSHRISYNILVLIAE